eukprot:Opistho-2@70910
MATAVEMTTTHVAASPSPIDASASTDMGADNSIGSPSSDAVAQDSLPIPKDPMRPRENSAKIGHRKVVDGKVIYKKTASEDLMQAIQLGLRQSVGSITPKERRDLLMQDFAEIEIVDFPSAGSSFTPVHRMNDFSFKCYAPRAFRHFREAYDIKAEDFLLSLCNEALRELSNPGASGSLFYISYDDAFIIKTVQKREAEFLRKLLPQYYMNMMQNKNTLLPKFFGLYTYQSNIGRNIRFVVMNNLLPSRLKYHERYDLKGSTHNRKASDHEMKKKDPTFKDLDLIEKHAKGLRVADEVYKALTSLIQRDCRVLSSLKIMDYSMLVGIHKIDPIIHEAEIRSRLTKNADPNAATDFKNGLLAVTENNEWCLVFIGTIDILQQYKLKKKLEHTWKAFWYDGDTVSVVRPEFYSDRFQEFMRSSVFQPVRNPESIPIVPLPASVVAAGVAPVASIVQEHATVLNNIDFGQQSSLISGSHNAVAPTAFIAASPAPAHAGGHIPKSPQIGGHRASEGAASSEAKKAVVQEVVAEQTAKVVTIATPAYVVAVIEEKHSKPEIRIVSPDSGSNGLLSEVLTGLEATTSSAVAAASAEGAGKSDGHDAPRNSTGETSAAD